MRRITRITITIRRPLLLLLLVTLIAPIVRIPTFSVTYTYEFIPDHSTHESSASQKQSLSDVNLDNLTGFVVHPEGQRFRKARHLNEESKGVDSIVVFQNDNPIKQVTRKPKELGDGGNKENEKSRSNEHALLAIEVETRHEAQKVGKRELAKTKRKKPDEYVLTDSRVRYLKDQLIRGRLYLTLSATRSNAHFIKELKLRMKDVQNVLGDATKDADLPKNAYDKLKAMDQILAKGQQIQDDCTAILRKLRAIIHTTEEQLRVHQKQALFLTHLTAKTVPKGLHCLHLRLSTEYYSLNSSAQQFRNQENLDDPNLFHYALFSDNVLAAAVVVNSTVTNAKDPSKHVFHIVTDKLNDAAMRMWFLANPPGMATIQVQNIDEFTWLNASYSPVLKQLASQNTIDYYFNTYKVGESGSNLKFQNPKYLSMMNHLRFYLPEVFPKLSKVVFLDDDIVVQKDLNGLWSIDLKGKVNGAVETCGESFHRFDRYLNFSNPIIAKNFDPGACGWAYGMNVFDLEEWKKQNITDVYHSWQNLNHERQLWKLGTLPAGLITFWKRVYPLEKSWHVLGLGYNPRVSQEEIERAAVIHYNGNLKPWLEIGIPKFRGYWSRYVDYDQAYMRDCNMSP